MGLDGGKFVRIESLKSAGYIDRNSTQWVTVRGQLSETGMRRSWRGKCQLLSLLKGMEALILTYYCAILDGHIPLRLKDAHIIECKLLGQVRCDEAEQSHLYSRTSDRLAVMFRRTARPVSMASISSMPVAEQHALVQAQTAFDARRLRQKG